MDAIPRLHGGRKLPTGVCKRTGALVHGKRGVPDDDVLNECSALIGMGYSDEIAAVDYVIDRVCLLDEACEGMCFRLGECGEENRVESPITDPFQKFSLLGCGGITRLHLPEKPHGFIAAIPLHEHDLDDAACDRGERVVRQPSFLASFDAEQNGKGQGLCQGRSRACLGKTGPGQFGQKIIDLIAQGRERFGVAPWGRWFAWILRPVFGLVVRRIFLGLVGAPPLLREIDFWFVVRREQHPHHAWSETPCRPP
jgi:hypothetical protein